MHWHWYSIHITCNVFMLVCGEQSKSLLCFAFSTTKKNLTRKHNNTNIRDLKNSQQREITCIAKELNLQQK